MIQLYQHLKNLTEYPLSNREISQLYDIPVISISQIASALQAPKGQWVVYIPNKTLPIGHWVLLTKQGQHIEYFDSYGKAPPNAILEQIPQRLTIEFNNQQYQKRSAGINTCGFHVLFRAFAQKYLKQNFEEYADFMKSPKDHDKAVVYYVSNYITRI